MATITIKIDSEQLAREVLTQLGYLPDDVPDLISVDYPEDPDEPVVKEPRLEIPVPSRVAFVNEQISKVREDVGFDSIIPEPNDDGFGTPIDHTEDQGIQTESMEMLAREKQAAIKRKLEKKDKTQKEFRAAAALMKERLTHGEYLQFLEVFKIDPNLDPDIENVVYELLGDTDEEYIRYFEEKDRISYKQYLNES